MDDNEVRGRIETRKPYNGLITGLNRALCGAHLKCRTSTSGVFDARRIVG